MLSAMLLLPLLAQDVQLSYEAPTMYIAGEPFEVTVSAVATGDAAVPAWSLTPAAFAVDGTPLAGRADDAFLTLVGGQTLTTSFDLSSALSEVDLSGRAFQLAFDPGGGDAAEITLLLAAPQGIDFMTLPAEQLADYQVVMQTVAGTLLMEFWPDVAPNHTRNFLDLAYTGYYDDSHFHRVVPGFMIQGGGAPQGKPAPRMLKNEFNERRHVPGVLSMARFGVDTRDAEGKVIPANDSATSEFFVMHAVYPSLDGKYTGFGKLVEGLDVVETIVRSGNPAFPRQDSRAHKPPVRQTVYKAIVVKAPKR
jgi:peptidyl-prolyl cis-trans isomerase B (cyclophilin B)